jgi:DNA-binding MarR family transcriptional regulator
VVAKLEPDLDARMGGLARMARGTGKISTLLLVGSNPGIRRPSVVARCFLKDRSAVARLLRQLQAAGLIEQRFSAGGRRARELCLTGAAGEALRVRVRTIALGPGRAFFAALAAGERAVLPRLPKKVHGVHVASLPDGASAR